LVEPPEARPTQLLGLLGLDMRLDLLSRLHNILSIVLQGPTRYGPFGSSGPSSRPSFVHSALVQEASSVVPPGKCGKSARTTPGLASLTGNGRPDPRHKGRHVVSGFSVFQLHRLRSCWTSS
jgi:hypothetical protein